MFITDLSRLIIGFTHWFFQVIDSCVLKLIFSRSVEPIWKIPPPFSPHPRCTSSVNIGSVFPQKIHWVPQVFIGRGGTV